MRVISYNILDGGVGRADPVAEVLLAQKGDIIGLAEADDVTMLDRIAKRLGMDVVRAAGSDHASAVLSRWPIVQTVNLAAADSACGRSALLATIEVPGIGPTDFCIVHLSPKQTPEAEQARLAEVACVLERLAAHRRDGRPHVLMGDFNAIAPAHEIDRGKAPPDKLAAWDEQGGVPREVIAKVLAAGYTDTLNAVHKRAADRAGTFTTLHPALRVDFIFTYGLKVVDAWVEMDRLATFASDHYPVGAELSR